MLSDKLEALINDLEIEHEEDASPIVDQLVPLLYDLRDIELSTELIDRRRGNTLVELNRILESDLFRKLHTVMLLNRRIRVKS